MVVETKLLTYEEYLALPEINRRYDIIDGELMMSPSPTPIHQPIAGKLYLKLAPLVSQHQRGEVFFARLDVLIQPEPLPGRQPDLMFIGANRSDGIGESFIEGAPDSVIEILSPSNTRTQAGEKLVDHATIGVNQCWLVSPQARRLRSCKVLQPTGEKWTRQGIYGRDDTLALAVTG